MTFIIVCARTVNIPRYRKQLLKKKLLAELRSQTVLDPHIKCFRARVSLNLLQVGINIGTP